MSTTRKQRYVKVSISYDRRRFKVTPMNMTKGDVLVAIHYMIRSLIDQSNAIHDEKIEFKDVINILESIEIDSKIKEKKQAEIEEKIERC